MAAEPVEVSLTDLILDRPNPWAKLYSPSRVPLKAANDLMREDLNMAAQYADWVTPGGWFTTTYVSRRVLRDTQMPTDLQTEAVFRIRRRWSKLTLIGTAGLVDRNRAGVQTTSTNVHFSAIREF